MRMGIVALVLTAAPAAALAQGRPGTNLIVEVHVSRVTLSGGTGRVEYALSNHGESQEELYTFTVDAPAPVLRISAPTSDDWATATSYRGRSVADWAALTRQLPPGATAAPFAFEAGGLPGIVTMWIRGYYPPPELTTENQGAPRHPSDPLAENSIRGRTVGLERFPADQSPAGLLDRLRGLGSAVCGELAWITSGGICHSLQVKLDLARQSLGQGRQDSAKGQLEAFLDELDAQHGPEPGKHVTDNAYWLLTVNAEFLLSRL